MRQRVTLQFPPDTIHLPLTYRLARDFDVAANIVRAQVAPDEVGTLVVELQGDMDQLAAALDWTRSLGITVLEEQSELQIDRDRCVDCGLCTGVCPTMALHLNPVTWRLEFAAERCVMCEQCIPTCPVEAIATLV